MGRVLVVFHSQSGNTKAAAEATQSDWSIVVGEPGNEAGAADRVTVVFRSPDGTMEDVQMRSGGTGELARARLTTRVLDQFRRRLQ